MSKELKKAIERLDMAIENLDNKLDLNKYALSMRQRDLFDMAASPTPPANIKAIAGKLDQTIAEIETILSEQPPSKEDAR